MPTRPPTWALEACRQYRRDQHHRFLGRTPSDDQLLRRAADLLAAGCAGRYKEVARGGSINAAITMALAESEGVFDAGEIDRLLEQAGRDAEAGDDRPKDYETVRRSIMRRIKDHERENMVSNVRRLRNLWVDEGRRSTLIDEETEQRLHPRLLDALVRLAKRRGKNQQV